MLALEPATSYFRGASRLLACESAISDMISCVDDIFVLDEGPNQYDARPGFYDFGATRTGIHIDASASVKTVNTQLAEITAQMVNEMPEFETLIAAFQRSDKAIRVFIFDGVRRAPVEIPMNFQKSDKAMAIPVKWWFRDYKIIDRNKLTSSRKIRVLSPDQARKDFDRWRREL